ncbi:MAG: DUF2147 domain-containing protein [Devosia sp.]
MTPIVKFISALAMALLTAAPALAGGATPIGQWEVTTGEARYKISSCGKNGDLLCAKLVWLRADERTQDNLAVLNTYVVKGAESAGTNKWTGNVVFDGRAYEGTLTMVSKNYLKLKGCAGILCQTYELTRV